MTGTETGVVDFAFAVALIGQAADDRSRDVLRKLVCDPGADLETRFRAGVATDLIVESLT